MDEFFFANLNMITNRAFFGGTSDRVVSETRRRALRYNHGRSSACCVVRSKFFGSSSPPNLSFFPNHKVIIVHFSDLHSPVIYARTEYTLTSSFI